MELVGSLTQATHLHNLMCKGDRAECIGILKKIGESVTNRIGNAKFSDEFTKSTLAAPFV